MDLNDVKEYFKKKPEQGTVDIPGIIATVPSALIGYGLGSRAVTNAYNKIIKNPKGTPFEEAAKAVNDVYMRGDVPSSKQLELIDKLKQHYLSSLRANGVLYAVATSIRVDS